MKCKFISTIGATCALPPPVAPPFIPNTGPKDGSLNVSIEFFPIFLNPSAIAIETVVFPSPKGVGLIAVTKISFPSFSFFLDSYTSLDILALYFPYCSISSLLIPNLEAISSIFSNFVFSAISISVILIPPYLKYY